MCQDAAMKRTTIFILCDALRSEYLERGEMPFLKEMSQKGYFSHNVKQSFGFCERSEIISGLQGDKSGFITAVGSSNISPYRRLAWLCYLFSAFETFLKSSFLPAVISEKGQEVLKKIFTKLSSFMGIQMKPYYIPYNYLPKLNYTEDFFDHTSPEVFGTPSIYDLVRQVGGVFSTASFTALGQKSPYITDMDRLEGGLKWLEATESKTNDRLLMIYLNLPDSSGHKYGPSGVAMNKCLRDVDKLLEDFKESVEKIVNHEICFTILGDHGMADVVEHVDIEKLVQQHARDQNISLNRDVMYFLDSTVARFWGLTSDGRKFVSHLKEQESFHHYGKWMTNELANTWDILWPNPSYGDELWVANTGALIFPDFFHRDDPYLGMHGYDPTLPVNQGLLVSWGDGVDIHEVPMIKLSQVYEVLKRYILRGVK